MDVGSNEINIPPKSEEEEESSEDNVIVHHQPINKSNNNNNKKEKEEEKEIKKRTLQEELSFIHRVSPTRYRIERGFVPNMRTSAEVIVNPLLQELLVKELCGVIVDTTNNEEEKNNKESNINKQKEQQQEEQKRHHSSSSSGNSGRFIPALKQMANVASLPGIVKNSLAMPDVHSGYGFCIGNVAAFDMDDPEAIVSPGGVGFDINCGVRLIRSNIMEDQIVDKREELCQALFDHIPVGVGSDSVIPMSMKEMDHVLLGGMDWALKEGYAWPEDREHCEENGRMITANPSKVSIRAKKRGMKQLGTLGAGNHYAEIQVVDEVYDNEAANRMGIGTKGQICIMIHSGSRGLGHQVATDAVTSMDRAMMMRTTTKTRDGIKSLNDRQLSCARINSPEGQDYIMAMSAAANYAWANRSCLTYLARTAFAKVFRDKTPEDMDMHLVYDVSHNIAKIERHEVDGIVKTLLVHRKGSTRAFPPHHPLIPLDYQFIGQPVLVGGTMGTCSYVLAGTDVGMRETFGSTCHGAGRVLSRNTSRRKLDYEDVLKNLDQKGISIRVASPNLVKEEAPESYKDVVDVVNTCQEAGISRKVVKLRPIAVIKG